MQSCYPIVNKFNTSLILPSLFSLPASCRRWSLLTLAFCRRWSSLLTLPLSVMSSSMVSTLILLDLAGGLSFCCWIETNITFCKLIFFIFQHDWAFNSVYRHSWLDQVTVNSYLSATLLKLIHFDFSILLSCLVTFKDTKIVLFLTCQCTGISIKICGGICKNWKIDLHITTYGVLPKVL